MGPGRRRGSTIKTIVTFAGPGVWVAESDEYQIGAEGAAQGCTAEALALYRRVLGRVRAGHPAAAILADERTCSPYAIAFFGHLFDKRVQKRTPLSLP